MTDRPILFSGPMVRAILDGRKTQTRRLIKWNNELPVFCGPRGCGSDPTCWGWEDHDYGDWITLEKDPGQRMGWRDLQASVSVGDRLWVREAWRVGAWHYNNSEIAVDYCDGPRKEWLGVDDPDILHRLIDQSRADAEKAKVPLWDSYYEYSWGPGAGPCRWRPSIHMPRWASRLTLTVTDVRAQRLQDISEEDAIAEGLQHFNEDCLLHYSGTCQHEKEWFSDFDRWDTEPIEAYRMLWDSLNAKRAPWDSNPWVAAYTFTVEQRK